MDVGAKVLQNASKWLCYILQFLQMGSGMMMLVVSCGTLFVFDDSLRFREKTTDSQYFDAFSKHYLL